MAMTPVAGWCIAALFYTGQNFIWFQGHCTGSTHIFSLVHPGTSYLYPVGKTESANKHKYHKFMHKMYLTTSQSIAPATHGLTRDEILDCIQDSWARFKADNDDD
ncbi:hypothetical protein K435DRAFT_867314 [Dendrothele bispora CBS 962.96]|uniref:Uncharacterized protein n=1 Tax=Dendrothele bispora (strain CBS 962.96) TaxID=1314807 RepID=A0A4S8LEL1_DENBC|nr:hypothetical protein K435DRAFT_867314 [Dendrothele bispora CBS 962.96]